MDCCDMLTPHMAPTRRPKPRRSRPVARPRAVQTHPIVEESGAAPGSQLISAYLAVANIAASIAFFEQTFGFVRGILLQDGDGQPRYAEMRHGDSVVVLVRQGDSVTATGGAAGLYTYVPDVDLALARAREAGAGVGDAEDKPWGDRVAIVTDPDGYRWALATFKKLVPFKAGG